MGISAKMEVCNSGFCDWFSHISEGKEFPADNETQTVSVLRISNHNETYLHRPTLFLDFRFAIV